MIVIEKPSENGDAVLAGSLLEKSKPANRYRSLSRQWFLDSKKNLWLSRSIGIDDVYQVESGRKLSLREKVGKVEFEFPNEALWAYRSQRLFAGYEQLVNQENTSVRETYLHHLKPIAKADGHAICITPLGLAKIKLDPNRPEAAAVVSSARVRWLGKLKYCLGIFDERIWFIIRHESKEGESYKREGFNVLASVSLDNWTLRKESK